MNEKIVGDIEKRLSSLADKLGSIEPQSLDVSSQDANRETDMSCLRMQILLSNAAFLESSAKSKYYSLMFKGQQQVANEYYKLLCEIKLVGEELLGHAKNWGMF